MKNDGSVSLPTLGFASGTKAITTTPVVGTPKRKYAEVFVPGEESLEDGEGNWIQTMPGKSYNVLLRLYGPLQPWFDKTWNPGDFEVVK